MSLSGGGIRTTAGSKSLKPVGSQNQNLKATTGVGSSTQQVKARQEIPVYPTWTSESNRERKQKEVSALWMGGGRC